MSVLNQKEQKIELTITNHDPKEFFQDREGLYVFNSFEENILSKAKETKEGSFNLTSYDLAEPADDEEIEKALPEKHLFSETEVCAAVADLIEKQKNGEEGTLLNNGRANLFYTPSRVVSVYWLAGDREWFVSDWDRVDDRWFAGDRVFSPATDLES